ncbi:MAG: hypothetical protein AAGI46_04195 [Planctomycetota bacterium]
MTRLALILLVGLMTVPSQAEVNPADIPEERYVRVVDGQLHADGERQRFWGVIGQLFVRPDIKPNDTPDEIAVKVEAAQRGTDELLDRLELLGFNAVRFWEGYVDGDYEIGDGSRQDAADYFIAEAGKRGFRIWTAGLNRVGYVLPSEVDVIDDPATAEAWSQAVLSASRLNDDGSIRRGWAIRNNLARIWDPRLQAIGIRNMTAVATHRNQHNGLRWCDDPTFAVWELSNEEWWMRKMVGGRWQTLPPFFRQQLIAKWNDYLRESYGDDATLAEAWGGLIEGESLDAGTVLLAPMAGETNVDTALNDASPVAAAAVKPTKQSYARSDFAKQRGRDVIAFFLELQLAHKHKEAAAIRPLGRSTQLSPMIFDTGIGYEIQSLYLHQQADAVAMGAYTNGWGRPYDDSKVADAPTDQQKARMLNGAERLAGNVDDPIDGGVKWINWLRKPPGLSQGVPWLEQNKIEGMPMLVYETQLQQPAKYRADYPLRIATLGSINDWDWVNWHYFGDRGLLDRLAKGVDEPFDWHMDITVRGHPQGYHFTYDEVQTSAMRAAAYLFRTFGLAPASDPTNFVFGRDALLDPDSMDYGGSYGMLGLDMMPTAYQHGARIRIDPDATSDRVEGPVVSFENRNEHNPYSPTSQIEIDWRAGTMTADGGSAALFVGTADWDDGVHFPDAGIRIHSLQVDNPDGMFDPITKDEGFVAFVYSSVDGRPIDQTRNAVVSLVGTSYNRGFELGGVRGEPLSTAGTLPVLVGRMGGIVEADGLDGMTYRMLDWAGDEVASGVIDAGKLVIPADLRIFTIDLRRD